MTDWDQLRVIGDQVTPLPFESLVSTAHKRDRRRRIVTGSAALALLAVVGAGIWAVGDGDGRAIQPAKDPSHSVSPRQVELPAGVLPLPRPDANDEAVVTEPGRYRIPLSDKLSLDVDLPPKTSVNGDGRYIQVEDTILKTEAAGETYGVPRDPCHRFNEIAPVGATVDSLVNAIRSQSLYRTSRPEPVEIGGAAGRYLELRIPAGFNASSCTDRQLGLPGNPGSNNNMEPGYVGRWWILDVGGQRTVLQAFCVQCDAQVTKRTTTMVQNITFTPAP